MPLACRPGIFAARHIYAGIGSAVARNGYNTISHRARTGASRKLGWLALSVARTATTIVLPKTAMLHAAPVSEVAFLVAAAARAQLHKGRSDALLSVLAQLEARDRAIAG